MTPIRVALSLALTASAAAQTQPGTGSAEFRELRPLLARFCFRCHGTKRPKGDVILSTIRTDADLWAEFRQWRRVAEVVRTEAMPPAKQKRRPSVEERSRIGALIGKILARGGAVADPGRPVLRRLNRVQFDRTVRDLFFGMPFRSAGRFPKDPQGYGFDSVGDVLFSSPLLIEKYLDVTKAIVDAAAADRGRLAKLIPGTPTGKDPAGAVAERALRPFMTRAFRRPPTPPEVASRIRLVEATLARDGGGFRAAVLEAVRSVLLSPSFLFRVEVDRRQAEPWPLPGPELAVRLSYFLWGTMPDRRLRELGEQGSLQDDEVLRSEVRRMLDDPRSRALADDFAAQWLGFREIRDHAVDFRRFKGFSTDLKRDLYEESARFFDDLVRGNRAITGLLDADYTFLNARLARHYGIPGVKGGKLRRVALPNRQRGGVLGMASVLTTTSYPLRTSPVQRGKWILTRLLGDPPAPPPADAGELPADDKLRDKLTNRQRLEKHRASARCASCHAKMDPLGFALERYDGVGRWRAENHGRKIDSRATMPDGTVLDGPMALRDWLRTHRAEAFVRTAASHLLVYALGRDLGLADEKVLDRVVAVTRADGDRLRTLIEAVALSYPFRHRRS